MPTPHHASAELDAEIASFSSRFQHLCDIGTTYWMLKTGIEIEPPFSPALAALNAETKKEGV